VDDVKDEDWMAAAVAAQRPVAAAVGGAFLVVCAAAAASAAAVSDLALTPEGPGSRLNYPPVVWLLQVGSAPPGWRS
jgi:hypothetical protein